MGADIHMYVEKRLPSGNWACVRNLNESISNKGLYVIYKDRSSFNVGFIAYWHLRDRNYELFAALAGVRGDGPEPRDLPQDVSEYVQTEYGGWGGDAHSASWYSAVDFVRIYTSVGVEVDEDTPLSPYVVSLITDGDEAAVAQFLSEEASVDVSESESVDLYRFVFWFDN